MKTEDRIARSYQPPQAEYVALNTTDLLCTSLEKTDRHYGDEYDWNRYFSR